MEAEPKNTDEAASSPGPSAAKPKCLACASEARPIAYGRHVAFCSVDCLAKWVDDELEDMYSCCPWCGEWSPDGDWAPQRDGSDKCPGCKKSSADTERCAMGIR